MCLNPNFWRRQVGGTQCERDDDTAGGTAYRDVGAPAADVDSKGKSKAVTFAEDLSAEQSCWTHSNDGRVRVFGHCWSYLVLFLIPP